MTHNVIEKGHPTGPWATASRGTKSGYGVMVGCGEKQLFFIPERLIESWLAAGLKVPGDDDLVTLVADAAATLPDFKRRCEESDRRAARAPQN